MKVIIVIIIIAIVAYYFYRRDKKVKECREPEPSDSQPMQFDLLDKNGDPIKRVPSGSPAGKVKVVIGGGDSDAPIQELQYFCIKDKGYHISVWPKNQHIGEYLEFPITGLNYNNTTLPSSCFCYIGKNNETYFSDCYVVLK